jgi:poly(rC)-binding protein 2/3/4
MPDTTESSLKRSRSPSDADTTVNKRTKSSVGDDGSSKAGGAAGGTSEVKDPSQASRDGDIPMKPATATEDSKNGESGSSTATSTATPSAQIHLRCLIVTQDASIIIGKGGAHVNEIREKSGARVVVSESIPGNPERILNVSGALDAVSKAFGLIVRRINDEPFDRPSVPGSRAVTIKFIIPNSRMGSVIGKGGSKIKEIQEASGARLNASEGMLPGSTERVLSVSGVADAIHIATYYVGNILIEAGFVAPASNNSYRPSAGYSHSRGPRSGSYGYGPAAAAAPYPPYPAVPPTDPSLPTQTQQIFIPNDLVGCIIGKGGSKINEIRSMSGSTIKIMEPGAQSTGSAGGATNERLVVITGHPANIQMAVQLLYHRLEQEKQKQLHGTR